MKVQIVLYDGFDELDAIGPYEVLRNAALGAADLEVALVALRPVEKVTASHGLEVVPQGVLDDSADLVLVPGGGWVDRAERGAWGEARRGDLPRALASLHGGGAAVTSVCTGAMLLSAGGLTDGRPATTHASARGELAQAGASVLDERVVDDGDLVTSGGVTAGIDMALWLVERHFGAGLADRVAVEMEHERRGGVWRRPS